ncbi:hypothetical protein FPZ12_024035 [Amycolatopsis acidicola]|uniref:Uncharacterized protein n=1 Tax=Amycolatopsis acidicola TaxID=2596893 RepID=A0A5N0UX55_9PSEU|nr:hypothetical protein [Amycolatopsis acidicola]KAA9157956.1 hypothetical protein FPZ12_024035 [Amycolatopsis acidicola]
MPLRFDQVRPDTPCPAAGAGPAAPRHYARFVGDQVVTMPGTRRGWGGSDVPVMISRCRGVHLVAPEHEDLDTTKGAAICASCRAERGLSALETLQEPGAQRVPART